MEKRNFIIQYVLNRAAAINGSLPPITTVQDAKRAYDMINELAPLHTQVPYPDPPKEQLR